MRLDPEDIRRHVFKTTERANAVAYTISGKLTSRAQTMTEEHNADNHCMAPGCEEPIRARGHCTSHYRRLRAIVKDPENEYTWKILGDAGVVPLRRADQRERVDTAGFRDETLTRLKGDSNAGRNETSTGRVVGTAD